MKKHLLKTIEPFYSDISKRLKSFELRKDDRNFEVGDRLDLFLGADPIDPNDPNLGLREHQHVFVTYKLSGGQYGLEEGYCILGITHDLPCPTTRHQLIFIALILFLCFYLTNL